MAELQDVFRVQKGVDITYRVTLEGRQYEMRIKYNTRVANTGLVNETPADSFSLTLSLAGASTPILKTPLKTERDILRPYRYIEDCPKGTLILRDVFALRSLNNGGVYNPERFAYEQMERFKLFYSV